MNLELWLPLAGIYLKIIQLEFKKIIILTTDTLHHRFYINRIYEEGFIIDSVFFQNNLPKPNFKTGPLFESKEEKFEITNFFKTTSRDLNKKIKVYNVNNINDRIVSDKIKKIKLSNFIFKLVIKLKGSIAAEHGIGTQKSILLKHYKSKEYYNFLKKLKNHLDTKSIMGRGKIL